jgi:hypothetical protein
MVLKIHLPRRALDSHDTSAKLRGLGPLMRRLPGIQH